VERCGVLLHLVDGASGQDVAEAYRVIRGELEAYGGGLADKPEILALNKIDALDADAIEAAAAALAEASGRPPEDIVRLSGAAGMGVDGVKETMWRYIHPTDDEDDAAVLATGESEAWSPY
jgi:GTP-binding protein